MKNGSSGRGFSYSRFRRKRPEYMHGVWISRWSIAFGEGGGIRPRERQKDILGAVVNLVIISET